MKKNISINISGIIFHIEEDGYETLRKYLDSVNKYFASFEDNSEILADIEGRIAEIFLSKLNDGKQVITADDVSSLMTTMGSVSDFKAAEEQEFAGGSAKESQQQKTSSSSSATSSAARKLYRDEKRKILGGVCAGLGHYFNIDPVWPRVLFALLVLGSYGGLILLYIILWIALPVSAELEEESSVKKMYRDPDKKVVGGVAAGVSAFFGIDLTIVRLVFVVLAFFGGLGLLLYVILWIVLPEAKTITEKMKMQGEPVTLSNIESTVKKGLNEKEGAEESTLTKIILFPFRVIATIITAIGSFLGPVLRVMLDILRVAIGLVIMLTGLVLILALIFCFGILIGLFSAPDWHMMSDWYLSAPSLPLNAIRNSFPTWTIVFSFLAAFVPALCILLIGTSIIAKKFFGAAVGWTLFIVFFISVAVISFSLPQLIFGFKEEGEVKVEQVFDVQGKVPVFKIHETGLDDYKVTSISVKGYEGKEIKLIERFQAQGPTRKMAAENAGMVDYHVVQSDSIITFDSNISFRDDAKFRAQRLDIDMIVPFNQPFVLESGLWRIIDTHVNSSGARYRYSLNEDTQTWKMTEKGLECISCPETSIAERGADEYGLRNFNSIDLKGLFNVRIEKGDDYAVEIKGSEKAKKRYDVYVNGETLVIDYDDSRKVFWKRNLLSDEEIRITITMPSLRELDITGAGKLRFRGFDEQDVNIKLMGAVVADGDIRANRLNIDLTGASALDLSGGGQFMDADILGASGLRAYDYEVVHCVVEAHGASSAKVNVSETLEITKGIASSVSHHGNPEVIRR
jgi:phage shock protein PspC (stress-responsive transcriptional regulator)